MRRTRTVLTTGGQLVKLRPVFRLAGTYVVCLPPEWVEVWLDSKDIWVSVEDLDDEPGFVLRPHRDVVSPFPETLPLGI